MEAINGRTHSLPVPYVSELKGGELSPGQTLSVTGKVLAGSEGFTVSLSSGRRVEDGCMLNLHLHDGRLHLNAYVDGAWGHQQKEKAHIVEDMEVDLRIRCHDHHFEVFLNHKELHDFPYRSPLSLVDHVLVAGAIELHSVAWAGRYYAVPYEHVFPRGLGVGRSLYISAMPEDHGAKEFCVSLLNDKGDVALHVNPKFDEKAVVRNAKLNGVWGPEEREARYFPFDKRSSFDMIIANQPYSYQVYINGRLFCAFAHRTDPGPIKEFQICGDVELQNIHYETHSDSPVII